MKRRRNLLHRIWRALVCQHKRDRRYYRDHWEDYQW